MRASAIMIKAPACWDGMQPISSQTECGIRSWVAVFEPDADPNEGRNPKPDSVQGYIHWGLRVCSSGFSSSSPQPHSALALQTSIA